MKAFYEFMKNTYEYDELKDIAEYGCANVAPSGMIYYHETSKLYDEHKEELHDVLLDWVEDINETPSFILEHLGNAYTFANAMVWFVAEQYANEIVQTMDVEPETN